MSRNFVPLKVENRIINDNFEVQGTESVDNTSNNEQDDFSHESHEFQEVELQELSKKKERSVRKVLKNHKTSGFVLEPLVSKQLGLEKEEKDRAEQRIKDEIEYRWDIVKQKAEVEGYQIGLSQGRREAFEQEKPRIEDKLNRLENLYLEISKIKEGLFLANEEFLMNIIAQIMRSLVLKELELDKDYLKRLVLNIISQVDDKENLRITISEEDYELLSILKESISKEFTKINNIGFSTSADLPPASCKVETNFGVIDASIEEQIKNAMKVLDETK